MYRTLLATTIFFTMNILCAGAQQQSDFNFSFYPSPRYALETRVQVVDTLTDKVSWKRDSTGKGLAILVSKQGAQFTISNLFNPTVMVYNEAVLFKGVDASGSLIYESTKESRERIVVNPLSGFVVVTFFNCEKSKFAKNREDCDKAVHLFGNAPKIYKP